VHLLQLRIGEAIVWLEKARAANPAISAPHARRLSADGRYSSVARLKTTQYFGVPKIRALFETTYFAGLRNAGMPEK
jgi:hypothetical protein